MILLKENDITMDNDIYFLQAVKNKIVVNNNYEGILVLDSDLSVIKKIDIYQDFCIYNAMVLNSDEILFNCIDNNSIFVVNIETGEIKKCDMPEMLEKEVLMKKIKTEGNHIIVKTYKNHFWDLDLQKMTFNKCNDNIVEEDEIDAKNCKCIEQAQIFMNELNIMICENENEYNIFPQMGYRFLGIESICDNLSNKLIVLSGSNNNEFSTLTSYCFK